jgi:hypothetical protein
MPPPFSAAPDPASVRVLAVASAGGHLVQLRRLRDAFTGCDVLWTSTDPAFALDVAADAARDGRPAPAFRAVPEASRWSKISLLRQALAMAWVVISFRPHAVITTGAAPGYFAIRLGNLIGARTIWIDSIANAEELSLSGRQAGRHADLFLTQWPHLADPDGGTGPRCFGAVL